MITDLLTSCSLEEQYILNLAYKYAEKQRMDLGDSPHCHLSKVPKEAVTAGNLGRYGRAGGCEY